MKKILGFGIVVFLVFMAAILTTNYWNTNNTEKDVLKYETSLPMTYKKLLNEYQESWNLSKGEAMGELESIGLSDQDNRGKYKILWVQLPKTEENICGGYIQFLCQTSQEKQEEMINEVLGMAFGLKEDERLVYNGKIKIWWRDNDRLEFVCNGEFGAAKRDEPRRLQSLLIKANEEKELSIYGDQLSEPKYYCYSHQIIKF